MWAGILKQGGILLWVIFGSGLLAFVVFVERTLHLHRARIRYKDFLKGIFNILNRKNITEALTICEETPGPVAYIVRAAILHRQEGREAMIAATRDATAAETSRMERRLVVVSTVAQIAPLLGLLGTVVGMTESALLMANEAPLIQSSDVLHGLVRALITTAAGLMVAVPCYVGFNLLVVKIDRLILDMDQAASEIVSFLMGGHVAGPEGEG